MKLKDAYFGGLMDDSAGKAVATKENQVFREFSESESWSNHQDEVTGELVAHKKPRGETCGFQYLRNFRES